MVTYISSCALIKEVRWRALPTGQQVVGKS